VFLHFVNILKTDKDKNHVSITESSIPALFSAQHSPGVQVTKFSSSIYLCDLCRRYLHLRTLLKFNLCVCVCVYIYIFFFQDSPEKQNQ
jgi:hypothetical protein